MEVSFTVGAVAGGAVVGALLGLRFKVLVLVPAMLIATVVIVARGHGLTVMALTLLGTLLSVQIGYMVGGLVRATTQIMRYRPATTTRAH